MQCNWLQMSWHPPFILTLVLWDGSYLGAQGMAKEAEAYLDIFRCLLPAAKVFMGHVTILGHCCQ